MIALSKTLDPADYADLAPEVAVVERVGIAGQHEQRRWEYALALRAIAAWRNAERPTHAYVPRLYDIGGAGSSFHAMPNAMSYIVDPAVGIGPYTFTTDVHTFQKSQPPLADIVTCLSVLEHVADWQDFLTDLVRLLRPGGLLFLTFDSCECPHAPEDDPHHFHWMRQRIATPAFRAALLIAALGLRCELFGALDARSSGPQVYDYSFSSLALTKKELP